MMSNTTTLCGILYVVNTKSVVAELQAQMVSNHYQITELVEENKCKYSRHNINFYCLPYRMTRAPFSHVDA